MSYISEIRKKVGHGTVIMPCACLIIGDGERVLLQKRADDGKWAYHGGAVEVDEKVEDALQREIKEELGITLKEFEFFGVYSGGEAYHHVYPNGDECSCIDIVYRCISYEGEFCFRDGEVSELEWFSELPENLSDSCVAPLKDYLKFIGNKV